MKLRQRKDWPETSLILADTIARSRSEDLYVQVGACAIKKDKSILLGYNGAPAGILIDQSDREKRRVYMSHAERNVLNYCKPGEIELFACTHNPCEVCIIQIRQMLIEKVYFSVIRPDYERVKEIAANIKVELIHVPLNLSS